MGFRSRSLVTTILLLLVAGLAAQLFEEPEGVDVAALELPGAEGVGASADMPLPPLMTVAFPESDSFTQLAERPPFSPSRRPPLDDPATETAKEPNDTPTLDLTLLGLNVGPNDRAALIRLPEADRPQWVRLHDQIAGWRVTGIDSDRLIMETKGAETEFRLRPQ